MPEEKMVSIIMPVYNGEKYIKQAIECVFDQSYQEWELIIVDDGSMDNTANIIGTFSDQRIHYLFQENRGEAAARNTGMGQMKGEYMAFIDADDLYFPNALEDMVSYLDEHPQHGSVFSDGYICDQHGKQLMRLTEIRPRIFTGNILNPLVITPSIVTVPVCTMTRTSSVRKYEMRFDTENNLIGTDWDFWIRLAVNESFGYLDKLTCKYRIHQTNITRVYGEEKRRKDYLYCRMKIFHSTWFDALFIHTKELFFIDLLTNALSGKIEQQQKILDSEQFSSLPSDIQSNIWRMVGIDVLQTGHSLDDVRQCLLKSNLINPDDKKTRFLLSSLGFGHTFTLLWVNLWRGWLKVINKLNLQSNTKAIYLQKLLEVQ
jgi:glycosyltransferase involved in cell wall biosynthesis